MCRALRRHQMHQTHPWGWRAQGQLGVEASGGGLAVSSPGCDRVPLLFVPCSDGRAGVPRGAAADERHAGAADEEDGHPGQAGEQH